MKKWGIRYWVGLAFVLLIGAGPSASYAGTGLSTSFTLQQLLDFLNSYANSNDPRKKLLWADLQQKLQQRYPNFQATFGPSSVTIQDNLDSHGYRPAVRCANIPDIMAKETLANLSINAVNGAITLGTLVMGLPPAPPTIPNVPITPAAVVEANYTGTVVATLQGSQTRFGFGYNQGWLNFNANFTTNVGANLSGDMHWNWGAPIPHVIWRSPPGQQCTDIPLVGTQCYPPNYPDVVFEWQCNDLAHEGYSVSASGSFAGAMNTSLDISLIPDKGTVGPYVNNSGLWQIVIGATPKISAVANVVPSTTSISVDTDYSAVGPLWDGVSSLVQGVVEGAINTQLSQQISAMQAQYTQNLPMAVYTLPANFDPALFNRLVQAVGQPWLWDYIQAHAQQILFYMLIGDTQSLAQMFASDAACASAKVFRDSSGILPIRVYRNANGACIQADAEGVNAAPYYADKACTVPIDFKPTPFPAWCTEVIGTNTGNLLGNSAAWTPDAAPAAVSNTGAVIPATKWSIAQSTQLPMSVEALNADTTPFMKRVAYRNVTWQPWLSDGTQAATPVTCHLEMRIYKKDVTASNLTPLLAIHGGAWAYRGFGFNGLEADISHFTDQGFIVFAPFYRLAGNGDGPAECHGAIWSDLAADADAALTWVQQNGMLFGAKGDPVTRTIKQVPLMGQSAGAHLSAYLLTHRPNDVYRAFLEYPPADVGDFIAGVNNGTYSPAPGVTYPNNVKGTDYRPMVDTLAGLLVPPLTATGTAIWGGIGKEVLSMSLTSPAVAENSFPAMVASAATMVPPVQMPPVFMLHGMMDTVVPPNQSVLLCNAYGGNAVNNGGGTALRATYNCGPQSYLHLFEEAQHAMDVCLTTRVNGMCLAGSPASAALLADSRRTARNWLQNNQTAAVLAAIISLILF